MRFAASATRMELLKLKKRIVLARRGHKLLRDKQDELMRSFMYLIEEWKKLRKEADVLLKEAFKNFVIASALSDKEFLNEALSNTKETIKIKYLTKRFLNLDVPQFEIAGLSQQLNYGLLNINSALDVSIAQFYEVFNKLIKLAEIESSISLISKEIKATRRRVNALEYILIPGLIETVRYITMKLSEFERSSLTRLMRLKEIIRSH
ncbi:MAG: V-type ATP synthase subunit D [Candidatus Omnitrophica bacterium]|nr:V-type ATP synthase subunit D [Candidatus Omnitrophota bacterium]